MTPRPRAGWRAARARPAQVPLPALAAPLLALVLTVALAPGVRAQARDSAGVAAPPTSAVPLAPPPQASPLVRPDHWSWAAARRLDVLGLAPRGYDRGRSLRTRRELAWLFERALAGAEQDRPALAGMVRGYRDRFREEFGDVLGAGAPAEEAVGGAPAPSPADAPEGSSSLAAGTARRFSGALTGGFERLVGRVATGVGIAAPTDWTGALPMPDTVTPFLAPELAVVASSHLSLHGEPVLRSGGIGLRDADLVAVLGPLGAWAGRRTVRFGPGEWGGIVLGDRVPLDGFGGFLAQPIHFPWLLRAMGPIQIESFFSKVYGGDRIRDPFFVAFRGTMAPVGRLTVGLNRAAMFGGRGNAPITFENMKFLLLGGTGGGSTGTNGGFANDVLSVDVSYRPPLERWLPVVLYGEWGTDDQGGMFVKAPGVIAGVRTGAVPGATWLSLGVERTSFRHSNTTFNTPWYRNWSLRNGWADGGVPVGEPLGGEGTELLGTASADLFDARLLVTARAFRRERGEQNLYAPQRMGVSHGGQLRLDVRLRPDVQLLLDALAERGAGDAWRTSQATASLRWTY